MPRSVKPLYVLEYTTTTMGVNFTGLSAQPFRALCGAMSNLRLVGVIVADD